MSTINDLAKEIMEITLPEEFECTSGDVIRGDNRHGNLLDATEGERKPVSFNSTGHPFHLKEPTFVTEVTVATVAKASKLRIEVRPVDGEHWERFTPATTDKNAGTVTFKVDRLVSAIRLYCDKTLFLGRERNEGVTRISVAGVGLADLRNLAQTYETAKDKFAEFSGLVARATKEIEAAKAQLQKQKEETKAALEGMQGTISELEKEKASLEEAVETSEDNRTEAEEKLKVIKEALEEKRARVQEIQARFDQLQTQIEEQTADKERLVKERVGLQAEVQRLTDNKNLFSDNLEGLAAHSDRNIRVNTWLFSAPVLIMAVAGVYLLWQAHEFFILVLSRPTTELWTLFVARSPLVLLGCGLMSGCWRLAAMFGRKIIAIQDFRLRSATLTMIATDVTHAAAIGLNLSDAEKYQLRTHLKMELLREQAAGIFPAGNRQIPNKAVEEILVKAEAASLANETDDEEQDSTPASPRQLRMPASRPTTAN